MVELEKFKRNQPLISANTSIWTKVCKFVWITYGSDPFDYIINANGGSTSSGNVWIDTYEENRHFYDRCSLIDPSTIDPNDIGAYSHAVWSDSDLEKCSNLQSLIQNCPNISREQLIGLMTLLDMNSITKNEFKKFSVMCGKPGAAEALNSFMICNNQTLNSPRSFKNYIANYTEIFEWMSSHNNDPIATQIAQEMIASLCGTKSSSNDELKLEDLEKDYEYIKNVVVEGDSKKKINLDFIFRDCFGNPNSKGDFIDCASFTGKLLYTLYVDQPEPNTRKNYVPPSDVGHAFVSLSLVSGGEEKNVTFGFYPEGLVAPIIKPGSKGQIQDDGGHHFDISIEIELTCEEFNSLLNSAISKQKDYHLSNYNCTDYALGLACVLPEQCGSIPDTHGDFPGGGGSNPGDLGEDLRSFNNQGNINTSGGSAPISKCH